MSSTVSSTELRTISKIVLKPKMEDRRLVRTSSLEKIRRFNTFICSQQYYILPALLAWLRSSQSGLQSSTEKTIFFFRSLIFSHFLYKVYHFEYKQLLSTVVRRIGESQRLLLVAAYATAAALAAQLGVCFYLLCKTYVPGGLVFLISCWFYIIYLNLRSVFFTNTKNVMVKKKN